MWQICTRIHDVYIRIRVQCKVADISSQSLIRYKQLQFEMSVIRRYKEEMHFENNLLKTTKASAQHQQQQQHQ